MSGSSLKTEVGTSCQPRALAVAMANLGRGRGLKTISTLSNNQTQSPELIKLPKTLCPPSHCSSLRGLFPLLLWKRPSMDTFPLWAHHCPISLFWLGSTQPGTSMHSRKKEPGGRHPKIGKTQTCFCYQRAVLFILCMSLHLPTPQIIHLLKWE